MRDIRFLLKPEYANSYGLVIGINDYRTAAPLSYAVNDATEIRDTLVSELAFPKENVTCLINDEATKANVLRSYFRFTRDDIGIDDRLIVFFAGHGMTRTGIRGEIGYLVPYDGDATDFSTFIRWEELTTNAELIRAKHVLFVMDACYGGLMLTRGTQPGSARFLNDMLLRYSRQVITAGKADEVVADAGGPIPNHSVFTGHLIEGIRGRAATEHGVITASSLMAYVYAKVANDKNSHQTPHYGYFDGDGDFILVLPPKEKPATSDKTDEDRLISIAFSDQSPDENASNKVGKVKRLLADPQASIELHDFAVGEIKRFLSVTADDNFPPVSEFSVETLEQRISKYESSSEDLCIVTACIAYWAKDQHNAVLAKLFTRSADRLDAHSSGSPYWLRLRWYPTILQLYMAGVAAIDANNFDSLAAIFHAPMPEREYNPQYPFIAAIVQGILEIHRAELFKKLPAYERRYTPMSDHLFKIIQPKLDDVLFLGRNYERGFDRFEVLFALACADFRLQLGGDAWGPIGRFGWKRRDENSPLAKVIKEAESEREHWAPLQAGLFGGSFDRFDKAAKGLSEVVAGLKWW